MVGDCCGWQLGRYVQQMDHVEIHTQGDFNDHECGCFDLTDITNDYRDK